MTFKVHFCTQAGKHAISLKDSLCVFSDNKYSSTSLGKRQRVSQHFIVFFFRCLPMNLVKEDLQGIHKDRMKIGASLADVDPMQIDKTVRLFAENLFYLGSEAQLAVNIISIVHVEGVV